jgi:hypothetical protein
MKFLLMIAVILSLSGRIQAEIRVWEDAKGHQYKAEFVHELFDKITLRDVNGTEFRLGVDELSELDQRYLRVKVAPEIKIDFSKTSSVKPKPKETMDLDNDIIMIIAAEVKIEKNSQRPYTSRLHAELYLIARDTTGGGFVLLSRTESDFLFTEKDCHIFKSEPVMPRTFEQNSGENERRGEEYAGYLIVVRDFEDKIVAVKTDMPDWIVNHDVINSLRDIYVRGAGSLRSRYFDRTGHKAPVPRPNYYTARQGKDRLP